MHLAPFRFECLLEHQAIVSRSWKFISHLIRTHLVASAVISVRFSARALDAKHPRLLGHPGKATFFQVRKVAKCFFFAVFLNFSAFSPFFRVRDFLRFIVFFQCLLRY